MKRLLDTKTKCFDQNSYSMPEFTREWGKMIEIFDFCLVNGSESQDILSITSHVDNEYPDDYWLLKISLNPDHGFSKDITVVNIAGAEPYVGDYRVQDTGLDYIILAVEKKGIFEIKPEDILYPEGATISMPPLGYTKYLEGEHKAVYVTADLTHKIAYLRIDNSCPEGYDPSYVKFSRVSMFTDIEHIDDIEYRLDRLKAPAWSNDYLKAESTLTGSTWPGCSLRYDDHYLNATSDTRSLDIADYKIIGDSSTFYYNVVLNDRTSYPCDFHGTFGEYISYLEPLSNSLNLLLSSQHDSSSVTFFIYDKNYSLFVNKQTGGKHMFNNEINSFFTPDTSLGWNIWETIRSGDNTGISFRPFNNVLNLNVCDFHIKMYAESNTVLAGVLRGSRAILANLGDDPKRSPKADSRIEIKDSKYLVRYSRWYDAKNSKILYDLKDWVYV